MAGSLVDHHGEWCALCLEYMNGARSSSERLERHHVLPSAWIADRFGAELDFAWVTPAHRRCHQLMQADADAAGRYLAELLAGARTLDARETLARWFHDRGYYWYSALINLDTLLDRDFEIDEGEWWRRCQYLLCSAAGIRGAQNLPDLVVPGSVSDRPEAVLALSNLKAGRGHAEKARTLLSRAVTIVQTVPHLFRLLRPAILRRTSQVERSLQIASSAISAAETRYSESTAFVIQGILSLDERRLGTTEEVIETLEARSSELSWLYRAEAAFMRALYEVCTSASAAETIYGRLTFAQYVYVNLGLQFSISPELKRLGFSKGTKPNEWTPADVLRFGRGSDSPWSRLGPEECTAIRNEWLGRGEPVYEQIFRTLKGTSHDGPRPAAGYSRHLGISSRGRRRLPLLWPRTG